MQLPTLAIVAITLALPSLARAEPLDAASADRLRITAHLEQVEAALRATDDSTLSPSLREARHRNLERLHRYWLRGAFPRNRELGEGRVPTFIDHEGRACAVAALMVASGETALAESIAARERHAHVADIKTPGASTWIARSGLTVAELGRIQPSYCDESLCRPDDPPVCGASGLSYQCLKLLESCTEDTFVSVGECPYDGPTETTGGSTSFDDGGCNASGERRHGWPWLLLGLAWWRRRRGARAQSARLA